MLLTWLSVIAGIVAVVTAVIYTRAAHRTHAGVFLVVRIGLGVGLAVLGGATLISTLLADPVEAPVLTTLTVLFALVALDSGRTRSPDDVE